MEKECLKVSLVTLIVNSILSLIKMLAGIFGHSSAMISDSIHSLSDVLSTIIVIIGIKLASKESDKGHPYGHERFENIASLILAFILFTTGLMIGINGLKNLYNNSFVTPTKLALMASILSIVVKEWMYWYTIKIAKKYNSDSLKADAWHHRSDALSSVGSLIGIVFAISGVKSMDVIASIIICFIIIKVAVEIFIDSIKKLTDSSCNEEIISQIEEIVLSTKGVRGIETLKTRMFGNKIYIDLEIYVKKNTTFQKAHEISHIVHDKVEGNIKNIKHCMVHISPK